jgi:replicative DNA helicase
VVALSQLSRAVEQREDKRPQLSDLRESGSIEQDADVVMFLYREEYYLSRLEPEMGTEDHEKWQMRMEESHNLAEAIVGKQRHGPTGTIKMVFTGELTRFSDYIPPDRLPDQNVPF